MNHGKLAFWVLACVILAVGAADAAVGPFQETFENPAQSSLYFALRGWTVQSVTGPPAGLPRWVPTFGENVSDWRNFWHGGDMPGYLDVKSLPAAWAVGGDYANTAYPIGFLGDYWFGSADRRWRPSMPWNDNNGPNAALDPLFVKLQSKTFFISGSDPDRRYFSFLVGGYRDPQARVRVALTYRNAVKYGLLWYCPAADPPGVTTWVPLPRVDIYTPTSKTDATSLVSRVASRTQINFPGAAAVWNVNPTNSVTGMGEQMQLVVMDLWGSSRNPLPGLVCARVEILDDDALGHINVDEILMSDLAELQKLYPAVPSGSFGRPRSVHGYADLHTHWMNHLGTGAEPLLTHETDIGKSLKGLLTTMGLMWGAPYYPRNVEAPEICGDGTANCGATQYGSCSGVFPYPCSPTDPERSALALPMCERARHEARWPAARYGDTTTHKNPGTSMVMSLMARDAAHGTGGNTAGCGGLHLGDAFTFVEALNDIKSDCFHYSHGWNPDTQRYQMPMRPFMDPVHQQMYWEWVRRAYDGGLRLLVTDVGHSVAGEMLLNNWWFLNNEQGSDILYGHGTDDWYAVRRQTCAVKKIVTLAPEIQPFAEIAYSPQQARDIIGRGKLAIVLGAEVDSLGSLRPNEFSGNPDKELDALQKLGVRKITPIHLVDNANGGAAVYDKPFYSYNDALNLADGMLEGVNAITVANLPTKTNANLDSQWRLNQFLFDKGSFGGAHNLNDELNDRIAHVANGQVIITGAYNRFFDAQGGNCGDPTKNKPECWTKTNFFQSEIVDTPCTRNPQGDCLNQRFASDATFQRPVVMWNLLIGSQHKTFPAPAEAPPPTDPRQQYWKNDSGAERNFRGLSNDGAAYLEAAARRALLIDIDHMSEKSRAQVLSTSPVWPAGCNGGQSFNQSTAGCQRAAYPVIATHAGVREARGVSWSIGEKNERSLNTQELTSLLRSGGSVGIGTGYQVIDAPPKPRLSSLTYPNDCPGSAKSLGAQYLWYIKKTEGAGVFDRFGMARPPAWLAGGVSIGSDLNGFAVQLAGRYNRSSGFNLQDKARCDTYMTFGDPNATTDPNQSARASLQDLEKTAVYYGDMPVPADAQVSAFGVSNAPAQRPLKKLFFSPGSGVDVQLGGGHIDGDGVPNSIFGFKQDLEGFDFNQTGVAHIGLQPDLMQDVVNPARSSLYNFREMQYQLRHLFHGAEDFIQAWEKAEEICKVRTGNSPTCTPQPPNDADECDMWVSDVDDKPTNQTGGTDDTPSCMNRCGQTLSYLDNNNLFASCDCFYDPVLDNTARLCADFKPWCKYYSHVEYNCVPSASTFPPYFCAE